MKHYFNINYVRISIFCPLLFLIYSCGIDNPSPELKELKSDKKKLEEIISPDFITRVDNKLVISSSSSSSGKMLYVYSLPDLEYLNSTGEKGKGPEEIQLFPMFCESLNQSLYVWGYSPVTIKKFDISQNGELKLNDIIKLPRYEAFNYMHILNDSLFIYYLPDNLKVVKVDLKNNKYLDDIQMKLDDHNESWFYSNRGIIAANDSFVIFGYLFKKEINIYRLNDFKLHKKITGNYKHKDPIVGDFETPKYYVQIVAGKNFFYALCNDNKNNNVVMEVYNYEGLFVNEFTFDITPKLFSVDEDNKMIYGFAYNDKYEPYLLKFNF
ncbi:MAG: hypothetical protein ACOCWM_01215 [Cyclobacteriaceae bacterium]